ncbi:hypothetical protein J6590_093064 [Homalodisca vitripennis]|nr:hypothetical protein J6590_093064 [Homalodisca vitripennis]
MLSYVLVERQVGNFDSRSVKVFRCRFQLDDSYYALSSRNISDDVVAFTVRIKLWPDTLPILRLDDRFEKSTQTNIRSSNIQWQQPKQDAILDSPPKRGELRPRQPLLDPSCLPERRAVSRISSNYALSLRKQNEC